MDLSRINPRLLILPLGVAVAASIAALIVRKIALRWWEAATKKTISIWDDIILGVIKTPSLYWCFAAGFYFAIGFSNLPTRYTNFLFLIVHISVVLSVTVAMAQIAVEVLKNFMKRAGSPVSTSGLMQGLVKSCILIVGFLSIFSLLGISIAPLLTALGVGGLAVALALKDTIENLFSGIYLLTDKIVRVSDVVKLEWGQQGHVEDIGWRTTKIRLEDDSLVVVPNSKLAQSVITKIRNSEPPV